MNDEWVEQELESFIGQVDSYKGRVDGLGRPLTPTVSEELLMQRSL